MKIILAVPDEELRLALGSFLGKRLPADALVPLLPDEDLMKQISMIRPKVVVMDVIRISDNGLETLRRIQQLPYHHRPEVIVLSSIWTDWLQEELANLRPMYFAPLPCNARLLAEQILYCCRERMYLDLESCGDMDQAIRMAVHGLGIPVRSKGCLYIREGIRRLYENKEMRYGLTKRLYPDIAKKFHTAPACVERSIRSAIEAAWKRDGILWRDKLFDRRPSSGELLVFMAEYLADILGKIGSRS